MHSVDDKLFELETVLDALSKVQAIIHFDKDGTILKANENFCKAVGYREDEIVGRHHSMFVLPDYARSEEYKDFWRTLGRGNAISGNFTRVGKTGDMIILEASYNALRNVEGDVDRVVKFAMNVTERQLRREHILTRVTQAANDISNESKDMIAKSSDLSRRSENQAATVEETSAAMEEISSTVNSNAKNAEQATEDARHAKKHAEKGSAVVEDAMAAMKKIEGGSKEIRKFIEVIDSIAFQTNLLALNAGVEAARAGDAGRGFAVVASEVRALAQRASESAKDINALIDNSTREVEAGARLVNDTGAVLTEITDSVSRVAEGIESIFAASREQASGILEINQSIGNIDKDIQQNAAMSEESTASATSLSQAASSLLEAVYAFGQNGEDQNHASGQTRHSYPEQSRQRTLGADSGLRRSRHDTSGPASPVATLERTPKAEPLKLSSRHKIAVNQTTSFEDEDDDWAEF